MEEKLDEVPEGAPEVEEWKDHRKREEEKEERSPREGPHRGEKETEDERSPVEGPHRGEKESEAERSPREGPRRGEKIGDDWEVRVFRLAAPMATKRTEETLRTAIEFVLRLRADGYDSTDSGHITPIRKRMGMVADGSSTCC